MSNLLDKLNKEQQDAVLHIEGPALVLAGAGSGKTRVLTYRVAHLIHERGIKPDNILAVTFTNKAAKEMRGRIVSLLDYDSPDLWVSTFHSSAVRILRRDGKTLKIPSNFVIFDTGEQKTLIKECMKELRIDDKKLPHQRISKAISRAKNDLVLPDDFMNNYRFTFFAEEIVSLYTLYQKKLRQNSALDFDDLIFYVVRLFENHPHTLQKYQKQFNFILIDEYQDINKAQYTMVRHLAKGHRNLFVVGDEDQSIYGFRGADMNIILNFELDFPEAKIVKLQQNYRSTQAILETSNKLVANNEQRREKNLWTEEKTGERPFCYEAVDDRDEAIYVIDEVKKSMKKDERSLSDYVILYRTNAQSRIFEEVLIGEGLPYQIIGGLKFYDRKEIKDMLAYLRLIINPADDLALKRIINVPSRGIGAKTISKLLFISGETGRSLYDILIDEPVLHENRFSTRLINGLNKFKELIESLRSVKDLSVSDLIVEILEKSGYKQHLENQKNVEAVARLENLEELLRVAHERNLSLEDFIALTSLSSDIDQMADVDEVLTLMTVHSAKGLEFPVVFITGMEENIFPHMRAIDTGKNSDIEEERRLAYVAITRAMEKLYFTYAWRRMHYGMGCVYNKPSRFLEEIKEHIDMPDKDKDLFGSTADGTHLRDKKFGFKKSEIKKDYKTIFFRRGDKVNHSDLGNGVVLEVVNTDGMASHLKVSFPQHGLRRISVESVQ